MSIEEIKQLIEFLPNIFIYVVPGFIFLSLYNYILNIRSKEFNSCIVKYVFISFIINNGVLWIADSVGYIFSITDLSFQLIACFISVVLAYIWSQFIKSDLWVKIMMILKINRTNSSNVFSEILDLKYGTWVRVYLTSEKLIYDGTFIKYEYNGSYEDSMIILDEYEVYKYGESVIDDSLLMEAGTTLNHVMIRLKEVSRIEITYDHRSKKIIEWRNAQKENKDENINLSEKDIVDESIYDTHTIDKD